MGRLLFVSSALFAVACTKANPEAACGAGGTCTNAAFPICDSDGMLSGSAGACLAPCVPGTIGACEGSDTALVCNTSADGYDMASCPFGCDEASDTCMTKCATNGQCSSGICKPNGDCAQPSEITFTSPSGSPSSDCSMAAPCTLERALGSSLSGVQYVLLRAGTYTLSATQSLVGTRYLVGAGKSSTTITTSATGPIFDFSSAGEITFDSLAITGAKGNPPNKNDGIAINIPQNAPGTRTLHVLDSLFTNNGDGPGGAAISGANCTVEIRRTIFDGNYDGVHLESASTTIDRCAFISNVNTGLIVSQAYSVTNSYFARSQEGFEAFSPISPSVIAFNTIVDNAEGVLCLSNPPVAFENTIVARNNQNDFETCTTPGSIIVDNPTGLQFIHGDSPPYDYHIGAGSTAIDAAQGSNIPAADYDGDPRPNGNAADVGADEAF